MPKRVTSVDPSGGCVPMIVHLVHSLEGGGTERTLVALLQAFDHARCRHAVVMLRSAGSLAARLPDHVACRPLGISGRSRLAGFSVARIVRRYGASVIHARNTGCWPDAITASLLSPRVHLVLGFHGLETDRPFSPLQRAWARAAVLAGARFTTVSQAGRRQLYEQAKIPPERIDLLRNGVDLRRFRPGDEVARCRMRAELRLDDDDFVVGTVGSLTPVKEHATLIRAAARAGRCRPALRLLIVGDGPLRTTLMRQAQAEGFADCVRFTGWRDDVPALLTCMDGYVCSSASEGMSNALLEAMAAGLPIIATNVGDHALVVRDNVEGWIVPPREPKALEQTLGILAANSDALKALGSAARARAEAYGFDPVVRAYETYYETLLADNPARQASPDAYRDTRSFLASGNV